ncbi:ABC transporter [Candidatus Epulonipiscium fishelsonii]|uniref:ABC transporter n=1 Tax=Candidatus Epulonipiscium fishelsonii TaxID=77094 RepID=A0ACC8XFJ0_9FIRM|nr:ABC transporter [Epulopiscium sp. SCG-B11WGA-EpuloA1]ONI42533.1 ABC transporter [Epulopiscium sp. SCG-B05WGA-EpuloA1]
MILLSTQDISKTYGDKTIFKGINLTINSDDKIGLIGINGTGKSSLLRQLALQEMPDKGEIVTSNQLVIEYLPQTPSFDNKSNVIEQIFKGTSPFMKVLQEYELTLALVTENPHDEKLQQRLIALNDKMDLNNAWQVESEAKAILTKLGITDFLQNVQQLSGGAKKKIALAGALIRPCNLLILDEPTNHLDNDTIATLEEILKAKKCAIIMVTHDRYFLDRVTNKIVELDSGHLYSYDGNYSKFLELKAEREAIQAKMEDKKHALYKQELEWMRKGVEARRTKQKARKERFYELESNLSSGNKDELLIDLATSRLGKKVIEVDNVSKSFDNKCLLKHFSYIFTRYERIGIVGNNGVGKSTLLNMLVGKIEPDSGTIDIGDTVKIGYYTQENIGLKNELRVIDFIKEKASFIKRKDDTYASASKMLELFLFTPAMQYTPISKLSGGEKRRLYLLSVLMEDINVLLLDEPTNDLDIQTLQILEDYIDNFEGPVIAVSHDRYFLDRIAERLFIFEGNGVVTNSVGNYSDYVQFRQNEISVTINNEETHTKKEKSPRKVKFTYAEQREFDTIEDDISVLEEKIADVESSMVENSTDYGKLRELQDLKNKLEDELTLKMDRWEYLTLLQEEIQNQ